MIFNSIEYLIFLPVVFLVYWSIVKLKNATTIQNLFLVISSYVFYGWWNLKFLILIALTTFASYLSGLLIGKTRYKKAVVWSNVLLNLGILAMFKYYGFFVSNLQLLLHPYGISLDSVTLNLILPVGISFYTFQALSYTIDVYRNKIDATKDIIAFFAFISFFPQLVAGPIERATNLLPQFLKQRVFDYGMAVDGMRQILWGLFKKMLVADNCAMVVNSVFNHYQTQSSINLWIGAILFAFQIYGDFSGYSDIAIGSAKLFGIKLMANFKTPYFSRDIAEFWRRWHISLTTWFRDYIYIPLGGSRCCKSKVIRNTFIIFLVSGFWHGANWTFIIWGAYHATLFLPMIMTGKNRKNTGAIAENRLVPSIKDSISILSTFLIVSIGWVIFRAVDMHEAIDYIVRMFTQFDVKQPIVGMYGLMWVIVMLLFEWFYRFSEHPFTFKQGILRIRVGRWALYSLVFILCIIASGTKTDFIYFQF